MKRTFSTRLWIYLTLVLLLGGVIFYMTDMPGESHSGVLSPLGADEISLQNRLEQHVTVLAGAIGERNVWHHDALEKAAGYIEETLRDMGYPVVAQAYTSRGKVVRNLEVEITGTLWPDEVVIIGAHYDSVQGSPGANDNASGVAALMVTDTALFRYPHYHAGSDTPDKIDYPRLARVVAGLARVTADLANKAS